MRRAARLSRPAPISAGVEDLVGQRDRGGVVPGVLDAVLSLVIRPTRGSPRRVVCAGQRLLGSARAGEERPVMHHVELEARDRRLAVLDGEACSAAAPCIPDLRIPPRALVVDRVGSDLVCGDRGGEYQGETRPRPRPAYLRMRMSFPPIASMSDIPLPSSFVLLSTSLIESERPRGSPAVDRADGVVEGAAEGRCRLVAAEVEA